MINNSHIAVRPLYAGQCSGVDLTCWEMGLKKMFRDLSILSNERGERVCYGETGIVIIW